MKIIHSSTGILFLFFASNIALGQKTEKDTLSNEKVIEKIIIQGTTRKGAESNIISLQKKSVDVIERVGSVQLEKQGVGDVSIAVTKATGTQKQESSGQIFIRGLGDRNNSTTFNGLSVPSNDPLLKNIDLSIIKTDMIDFVSLEKVYTPRLWGDLSGANVDIVSKVYTGKPYFKINLGSSVNFNAIKQNQFLLQDGPNYFGFKEIKKPSNNSLLTTGYPFTTSWNNRRADNPFNSSLSIDFGTNFSIGNSGKLSLFGFGSFDNGYEYAEGIMESSYDAQNKPLKYYNNSKEFKYLTNTTGLMNINYRINPNHVLNLSSNYIHTTDQKLGFYNGYDRDYYDNDVNQNQFVTQVKRGTYKTNDLFINQLKGDHALSEKLQLGWNIGFSRLDSKKPDRQQNISIYDKYSQSNFFASSNPGANNRYYDQLTENDFTGDLHADYKFGDNVKLSIGYLGRYKKSDFEAVQFNFRPLLTQGTYALNPNNYDAYFNLGTYQTGAFFSISTFRGDIRYNGESALVPQTFNSEIFNNAGYANLDYKVNDKLTAQMGVRYDNLSQNMDYDTAIMPNGKISRNYSKILPALNFKYSINNLHNLRLSVSKTYTTPLLLEIAPFEYEDVGEASRGNLDVYPSDNYNLDLKWEFFPKKNEVISATLFGKYIQNPIARITMSSSSNTVSFLNVGNIGRVYGAEIELRKDLYQTANTRFYTFLNGSYINTYQELNKEKIDRENSEVTVNFLQGLNHDKMQGASEFLANANLGWEQKLGNKNTIDLVVSYSYISDSIYALGFEERGNIVDKAINLLDTTLRIKFSSGIGLSFAGKNLLNPVFKRVQENRTQDLISKEYKKGVGISAGVSYQF